MYVGYEGYIPGSYVVVALKLISTASVGYDTIGHSNDLCAFFFYTATSDKITPNNFGNTRCKFVKYVHVSLSRVNLKQTKISTRSSLAHATI